MPTRESAGILLYRRVEGAVEVLIAHPGGPYWRNKDNGAWSLPKGELDDGEDAQRTAIREFAEEIGYTVEVGDLVPLGSIRQKSGKTVHAWAAKGDLDPDQIVSNTFTMEWPPRSGRHQDFPEIDAVAWVDPATAVVKLNAAQGDFVRRLIQFLGDDH